MFIHLFPATLTTSNGPELDGYDLKTSRCLAGLGLSQGGKMANKVVIGKTQRTPFVGITSGSLAYIGLSMASTIANCAYSRFDDPTRKALFESFSEKNRNHVVYDNENSKLEWYTDLDGKADDNGTPTGCFVAELIHKVPDRSAMRLTCALSDILYGFEKAKEYQSADELNSMVSDLLPNIPKADRPTKEPTALG